MRKTKIFLLLVLALVLVTSYVMVSGEESKIPARKAQESSQFEPEDKKQDVAEERLILSGPIPLFPR